MISSIIKNLKNYMYILKEIMSIILCMTQNKLNNLNHFCKSVHYK